MDPHECIASVLVAQDEVDEAVTKATDAQIKLRLLISGLRRQREMRMRFGSRTAN